MFLYGVAVSPVDWTPGRVMTVVLMLFGGTVLFISLFLLGAAFTFFTMERIEAVIWKGNAAILHLCDFLHIDSIFPLAISVGEDTALIL